MQSRSKAGREWRRTLVLQGALALLCAAALGSPGCADQGGRTTPTSDAAEDAAADTGAIDTGTVDSAQDSGDTTADSVAADTGGGDTGADTTAADTSGDVPQPHGAITGLSIDPPAATIRVVNGVSSPVAFTAVAAYADGFTQPVTVMWRYQRQDLAVVDGATGVLTATGRLGGSGTLQAILGAHEATASVTVVLEVTENPGALTQGDLDAFLGAPTAQPSGTLLYPYDQTVFARGIGAPELMWDGGASGDKYAVRLRQDTMEATWYVVANPPSAFKMPEEAWALLTASNAGESVQVSVQRLTASGSLLEPAAQTWKIAQGSLRGTIYYWAVNQGRPMKITPGATAPTPVFDAGPATDLGTPAPADYDGTIPPWSPGADGDRCVSCHTVSRNGNAFAAVFERKSNAASPWGLVDLTQDPPQLTLISSYLDGVLFVALSPDATWAVPNSVDFTMQLVDTRTGATIASALDAFVDNVADASFAPDASALAFSARVTGSYPVEFSRADLDVMDFDNATGTFSNRRELVNAGSQAIAFPSFTPDASWVVYQRGSYSRAKFGQDEFAQDDLFMTDVAGQVGQLELRNLNGTDYLPNQNLHLNYEPRVNPIVVGGYVWVVFFSPRDYGNRMRASVEPALENRKQLWVAAVDLAPQANADPSHPAFWLPGQDLATINMSGYWALDPCRQDGGSCAQGFECCSGYCQPDGVDGALICVPPTGQCSLYGEVCSASSDCCEATALCLGGFCTEPPN